MGAGTFGKVVKVIDKHSNKQKAIKIIRSIEKYKDAALVEIKILKTLKRYDPLNLMRCIHLEDCFEYKNHICMVFELLDTSMFDFLRDNDFHPFPLRDIKKFAYQMLSAVAFLHSIELIHTDLKPGMFLFYVFRVFLFYIFFAFYFINMT